jgi:hypothetical protein
VVVRRPVYEAGIKLEAEEAAGGWKSFDTAEAKMDENRCWHTIFALLSRRK